MKHYIPYIIIAATLCFTGCKWQEYDPDKGVIDNETGGYANPVLSGISLPDPTVIKGDDGYFYAYGTEDIYGIPIFKSKNLVDWGRTNTVFTSYNRPSWGIKGAASYLWAPDINKVGDKYVLYYSHVPDDLDGSGVGTWGIGVATADKPAGPFYDKGKILTGEEIGQNCCIDPAYFEDDNGKKYLLWGSFFGIHIAELNDDGLSLKDKYSSTRLAGTDGFALEGAWLYKKNNYYYLFCSNGPSDYEYKQYRLTVGRATSITGPYVTKNGGQMLNNSLEIIMESSDDFYCPGHNAEIITDDKGVDWILYHAFIAGNQALGRELMLDKVTWDADGWPAIGSGIPTVQSDDRPYFK